MEIYESNFTLVKGWKGIRRAQSATKIWNLVDTNLESKLTVVFHPQLLKP
jgi:hypothetical protein